MKAVHNIKLPQGQSNNVPDKKVTDETREFVNYIFRELQSASPAWRASFPDNNSLVAAKRTWLKALVESRITNPSQIEQGLRMARKDGSDFFPSVGKFISWCGTNAKVPDRDTAFAMLEQYTRCEYHAIPREVKAMFDLIGKSTLRKGNVGDIYRAFRRNYKFICEKLNDGSSIDKYLIEKLPKPKEPELSPEEKEARRLRILSEIQKTKKTLKGER
ncbi:TPA: replication protein P [Vibrio parahaemolyticus]